MIIKAKDIHDCEDCPLHDNEYPGGWTSGAGGTPIEPPCCDWDDEDDKTFKIDLVGKCTIDSYNNIPQIIIEDYNIVEVR